MRGKTNLARPLKTLNHLLSPLHDLIIRLRVKHLPKNLHKKVCFPMHSLFTEKVSLYFVRGRGDTMLYHQIFSHFEKLIPNFYGTNYDLLSKTT